MQLTVTKRTGVTEVYQVEKIKNVIKFAVEGLDVNALELESKFDETLYDGIPTDTIHKNLVHHARTLCTANSSDWTFVAGRLQTMLGWAETGAYDLPYEDFIEQMIERGTYKHPALEKYTREQRAKLGKLIDKSRDLDHSYGSVITAQAKYLMRGECIQQKHMTNAMIIASVEDEDVRLDVAADIYEAMSLRKISLATPWLSNLRANGNISSCFALQMDDSLESIFDNVKNIARISKSGGGVGVDISRIRSKGAEINGRPNSSGGVVRWIKIINDTAVAVDQCFVGETLIEVEGGQKLISELVVGDKVRTNDGSYKPVTSIRIGNTGTPDAAGEQDELREITTSKGTVKVTGGHPVYVAIPPIGMTLEETVQSLKADEQRVVCKWISARDLKPGMFTIKT